MPTKDVESLKRPDLQGYFVCGSCGQCFAHAASLNRHRRTTHSSEQICLLCNNALGAREDLHVHMRELHNVERAYTCGCCNYTFHSKTFLHEHTKSIKTTGQPGNWAPIAKSTNTPGSLLMQRKSASPYSLPVKQKAFSLSPTNTSGASTPSPHSENNSANTSPKLAEVEKQDDLVSRQRVENVIYEAVFKIIGTGNFSTEQLLDEQIIKKIFDDAIKNVIEDLQKKIDAQNETMASAV